MQSKGNDFIVDTKGHCFICLNKIKLITGQCAPTVQSIQYLSRYLKLDLSKVFQSTVSHHLLEKVKRSRLKVELCSECSSLNDKLSELFEQLERIEMNIIFRLNIISEKINLSEDSKRMELIKYRFENCNAELNTEDLMGKLEIAQVLREETNRKC